MSAHIDEEKLPLHMRRVDRVLIYGFLTVFGLAFAWPLINAVQMSVAVGGIANYWTVLTRELNGISIPLTFVNSAIIAVMHAALVCSIGALAAYAFSFIEFRGREWLYYGVLLFLAVPATAILVPVYFISGTLSLFNTHIGVALPEAVLTLPFAVLLLRNRMDDIPRQLVEAAVIDRATHRGIFWHVALPLCRGPLANLAALSVMWSLQDFIFPSVLLRSAELTTAAQAVQGIRGAFAPTPLETSQYFAALVLLGVPAVIIIVFAFRYVTRGLAAGGVKE
ncbi:carbohydrate ABC transporter permease [Microbacterium sp. SSW1-59]|uniref:carbohydrate ABC transporter permease n=1 Tax=Microbacterium xanthum TaxID=3079794 RepID=UPI002AD41A25|nr:carbohydrate ABC transporter permease [Microbacterium sp. SSW1-59]MDZ8200361.1 carbohydrate ABC transporter permease [Microbacterium sp. SSW1-59]